MLERAWYSVCGEEGVREAECGEHAVRWAGYQVQRGGDDAGAGAFTAHQSARHVEPVLGKQIVKIVAGDPAGNAGKLFPDQAGVAVAAQPRQTRINLAHPAALADGRLQACSGLVRPTVMRVPS